MITILVAPDGTWKYPNEIMETSEQTVDTLRFNLNSNYRTVNLTDREFEEWCNSNQD